MIPGGFTPADRPTTEQELRADSLPDENRIGRSSAKSAWLTLAVIVLVIVAMIVLLSFMPDA